MFTKFFAEKISFFVVYNHNHPNIKGWAKTVSFNCLGCPILKDALEGVLSKKSQKSIEEKLPDRYPRSEEILIFGDMSELDYVFGFLDELKGNFLFDRIECYDDEQRELINHSGVYTLSIVLRKAF